MSAREEFEQFVVPCYVALVNALRPSLLLDHLRQARLISGPEYRELQAASSEEDRSRRLLDDILPRKEKGAYRKFCEVLLAVQDQKYIVAAILEGKGPRIQSCQRQKDDDELPSVLQRSPTTVSPLPLRSNTNHCSSSSAEVQESPSRTLAIFCAGEVGGGSTKAATFFFKPECYSLIQANEFAGDMMKNLCEQCLGVEREKVVFVQGDVKSFLKAKGYAVNCDIDTLLAVLIVYGIEQKQLDINRHNLESAIAVMLKDLEPARDVSVAASIGISSVEADVNKANNQSTKGWYEKEGSRAGLLRARQIADGIHIRDCGEMATRPGVADNSFLTRITTIDGTEQPITSLVFEETEPEGGKVQFQAYNDCHPLHSIRAKAGAAAVALHEIPNLEGKSSSTTDAPYAVRGDTSEVTEAQLNVVAMVARTKWLEVGQYLGLKMSDLEEYEEREPKSLHYRLFRLLVDWKRKVENPTVGDVVLACQKAGVGGDVKRALQAP